MNSKKPLRIEKYLSEQGIASRRESRDLIKKGYVFLNGKKVMETGIKIDPNADKVELASDTKNPLSKKMTVMVYKPRGVTCSKDKDKNKTVFDSFPKFRDLNTVGRLDKESEGLLLLSNDGMVTKAITDKSHPSEKEYVVTTREDVLPWMIRKFESGIRIDSGYKTLPAKSKKIDRKTFSITLKEGKKHQIRRMANAVGLTINSLKRIRINDLELKKLRSGQFAVLNKNQVEKLRSLGKTT